MGEEIWRQIPGFGGFYEASSLGRVRVKTRVIIKPHSQSGRPTSYTYPARILKRSLCGKGYFGVHIGVDGVNKTLRCCRAVLMAFVGMPPEGTEACHGDGNPGNDCISNLRWDTHYANNQDRKAHGNYAVGEDHAMCKLTKAAVMDIRNGDLGFKEAHQKYSVSMTHFYRIKRGDTWKHLLNLKGMP